VNAVAASDLITAALDGLVAAIVEAGLPATREPADFQPPGVIVAAPTITGAATLQSIGLLIPVYVVAGESGRRGLDWMLAAVTVLLPVFRESAAEPTLWNSPINPAGLSAYLISVRVNVAQTGENHAV
jgi:hypothetical protein